MRGKPVSDWSELVFFFLAHFNIDGPGNIFAPSQLTWIRARLTAEECTRLDSDVAVISARWRGRKELDTLQALPDLLHACHEAHTLGSRPFTYLQVADVREPALLRTLQALDRVALELVWIALTLLARSFADIYGTAIGPLVQRSIDAVHDLGASALGDLLPQGRLQFSGCLGRHGRVLSKRIVVGVPMPWNDMEAATSIVLALHERAVGSAETNDYLGAEWHALTCLAKDMEGGHYNAVLTQAHCDWLSSLDLHNLLCLAVREGLVSSQVAQRLQNEPLARAGVFARVADKDIKRQRSDVVTRL